MVESLKKGPFTCVKFQRKVLHAGALYKALDLQSFKGILVDPIRNVYDKLRIKFEKLFD